MPLRFNAAGGSLRFSAEKPCTLFHESSSRLPESLFSFERCSDGEGSDDFCRSGIPNMGEIGEMGDIAGWFADIDIVLRCVASCMYEGCVELIGSVGDETFRRGHVSWLVCAGTSKHTGEIGTGAAPWKERIGEVTGCAWSLASAAAFLARGYACRLSSLQHRFRHCSARRFWKCVEMTCQAEPCL